MISFQEFSNQNPAESAEPPLTLTQTQSMFIRWNAERLGITTEESRRRFFRSWASIPGGHGGVRYREFNSTAYELYQVFFDDNEKEILEAYRFHAQMHFLRMLSYPEPSWLETDPVVQSVAGCSRVAILDFGCGLAQQSRSLAEFLLGKGISVHLTLADIPTMRREFLIWLAKHQGIPMTWIDCTADFPLPSLPETDVCFATEFFEHVHNPCEYFDFIDRALKIDGLLITNISDHQSEFMHVSPNLQALRSRMAGYEEIQSDVLFRKRFTRNHGSERHAGSAIVEGAGCPAANENSNSDPEKSAGEHAHQFGNTTPENLTGQELSSEIDAMILRIRQASPLSLHLGAGAVKIAGMINCDMVDKSADRIGDCTVLTEFADASVDLIETHHMIEHLSFAEAERALDEWARVLKPGAYLVITCPDLGGVARHWLTISEIDRRQPCPEMRDYALKMFYGTQQHPGMFHKSGFDAQLMRELLAKHGFDVEFTHTPYPLRPTPSLLVIARRSSETRLEASAQ